MITVIVVYVADDTGKKRNYFYGVYGLRGREYGSVGPWSKNPMLDRRSVKKFKSAIVKKVGTSDIEIKIPKKIQ